MHLVFLVLQWWTYMINCILKIVNDFLKEQYPNEELKKGSYDKEGLDNTVAVEYTFLIDYLPKKELKSKYVTIDSYPWVTVLDNRSGSNKLLKRGIHFRYNKIRHSRVLTNQLELLGLMEIKTDPNFWENLYNL